MKVDKQLAADVTLAVIKALADRNVCEMDLFEILNERDKRLALEQATSAAFRVLLTRSALNNL